MQTLILLFGSLFLLSACNSKPKDATAQVGPTAERGRAVYQTQCTACHNADPRKPGSIGPDVFGSSKELLAARILKAEYPAGYKPKRETHAMVPLPHLKNEIDSIHLFLNQDATSN